MKRDEFNRRCFAIAQIGCLACSKRGWFNSPDVHHLNLDEHAGQKRRGDEFTIGLCPWHHRGVPFCDNAKRCRQILGPSLAKEPIKFREEFGSDDELLDIQNDLIAKKSRLKVGYIR
jgi:hypothetical protein